MVGLAVRGAVIGFLTCPGALLINAGSFEASAAVLRSIRKLVSDIGRIDQGILMIERLAIGLKFVGSNPTLRA